MTDDDLLAPFDGDLIETVADRHDLPPATLRDLLARHQRQARDNPGVEDLVYEWRSQFHDRPVVRRTGDAYYLRLREYVWDEFAEALDIADADFRAVLAVHEDQTRRDTDATPGDGRLMILARPR